MANENEKKKLNEEEDDEPKIPVFTVLKNGAILKNIFIVNKPPPPPANKPISSVHQQTQEEILIVGRHPDCNIVLTHPSISRFHLQILSNPSSQQLSLTDLSSVHGTWVSEKRLEPGVRVELREGDILRVGGSSRVYSLHWIPLGRAYDFETSYVPLTNNDEDETAEGVVQGENSLSVENKEIESPDSNSVGIESLLPDENFGLSGKEEIPSAPPMPENAIYSIFDQIEEGIDEMNEFSSFWAFGTESVNLFLNMEESSSNPNENPDSSSFIETERETYPTAQVPEETENQSPLIKDHGQIDISCPSGPLVMENLPFPIGEVIGENKDEQVEEESLEPISNLLVNLNFEHLEEKEEEAYPAAQVPEKLDSQSPLRKDDGSLVMENLSLPIGKVFGEDKEEQVEEERLEPNSSLLVNLNFEHLEEKEEETYPAAQVPEKIDSQSPLRKNDGPLVMENLSLPIGEVLGEDKDEQVEEEILEPISNLLDNLNFERLEEKEEEAYPAAQVPEKIDSQSPLRKNYGPLVMENLSLPIGDVLGEDKDEQVEEEILEPISNLLDNLNFERLEEKEEEAYTAAQVPEKIDSQSPLRKNYGPIVMENLSLPIGDVLGEDKDEQVEEEILKPISNLLDNLNFEHLEEKEEEAYPAAQVPEKIDSQSPLRKDDGQTDVSCLSSPLVMENLSFPFGEVLAKSEGQQVEEESLTLEPELNLLVNLNFEHSDEIECPVDQRTGETENKSVSPEDHEKRDSTGLHSEPRMKESINSSTLDGILSELIDDRESQTPQSLFTAVGQPESDLCESPPLRSENKSGMRGSIWARRGKRASVVQLQTDKSRGKTEEARYGDDIELEEEIFTPDKENLTPNTLRLRSLKRNGEIEFKHSKSHRSSSSKLSLISSICQQDLIVSPEKENQKLKELRKRKSVGTTSGKQARVEKKLAETKERRERMPFQSLLKNSGGKNISETSVPNTATRNSASASCTRTTGKVANPLLNKSFGEGKRRGWTMVADTTTLLDKESRKSLQLLQGLKGTRLIIPRMVLRELDCLKQRGSLFRRKTEACLVLEWIEDCMVKTNWWIHVQSSMEDGRLIAPTPPVSPQSLSSDKSWVFPSGATSSLPFSRWSLMDLVSPTAEDHILDCALLHRKMKNDGQLVLLSNDVTLKIKAMAEGLLCETAEEFRESLVNPISERFMWPDSSPRGRTWSYIPDAVLRERYSSCPLKKSSTGEGAKGLKLILLHNSHYGQIR